MRVLFKNLCEYSCRFCEMEKHVLNDTKIQHNKGDVKYCKRTVEKTKNIPRNWLCHLFGHFPDCTLCDPDRETQPLIIQNN